MRKPLLLLLLVSVVLPGLAQNGKKVYADFHGVRYTRQHDGKLGRWEMYANTEKSTTGRKSLCYNADLIDSEGRHEIAAVAYPQVGMQSNLDPDYIEYQILSAKVAKIDGFFIEWGFKPHENDILLREMQKVAAKHGLACLLHEKPFAGVNGSGKHNNWSISTDSGVNLLSPGDTPYENAQFLLFLCAVIKAVDDYQDLLRLSVATAGNDHRLGANEAPPAVVSIFLGDELNAVLEAIEKDIPYAGTQKTQMKLGVDVLPKFNRDTTDRNRTSPFAFTGNKFEFRMLGSSNSIACANIMLNSAVAESLRIYADRLEKAEDFETALHAMIRKTIQDHKNIIFNGNGYDESWIQEATQKRGLLNYRTTADCMPHLLDKKNVEMLTSHKVFSEAELRSRCEIMLENYCKTIIIEANTMTEMVQTEIAPAVSAYSLELSKTAAAKKALDAKIACSYEKDLVSRLSGLTDEMAVKREELIQALSEVQQAENVIQESAMIRDEVLAKMEELRAVCDQAEILTAKAYWPFPTYGDILFSVR